MSSRLQLDVRNLSLWKCHLVNVMATSLCSFMFIYLSLFVCSLRPVYSDTTQLNWPQLNWPSWTANRQSANQREASQSCFCLWRNKRAVDFSWVELSCIAIHTALVCRRLFFLMQLVFRFFPSTAWGWRARGFHAFPYLHTNITNNKSLRTDDGPENISDYAGSKHYSCKIRNNISRY